MAKIKWETIDENIIHGHLHRTKVPGGWLVRNWNSGSAGLHIFLTHNTNGK
jgi:hypothetical protein